jgi:dienelactone hydrolase
MRATTTILTALALHLSLGLFAAAADSTAMDSSAAAAGSTVLELAAADGVKLAATYTSPGKPGPGVLLLHMCNSDRSAWAGLAEELASGGIHSLALDYRGYGDSGGEQVEGDARQRMRTEVWPRDVDAAFEVLRSQPGVDRARIGAAGGSCGVDQAVTLARRHPGEVTALVLLAGGVGDDDTTFLAENPWLPVLGAAALDDGQAVDVMRWTIGFSGHPESRFLEVPYGGHGTEMFAVHADLVPAIADWFEQHLIDSPARKPEQVTAGPGPSYRLWQELLTKDGVARFAELLRASPGAAAAVPPEGAINDEGYRLIAAGEHQRAIELLALNVEAYPQSANALDSLGDAYLAAGQPDQAAEYAQRAIDAIPGDKSLDEDFAVRIRQSAESKLKPPASE